MKLAIIKNIFNAQLFIVALVASVFVSQFSLVESAKAQEVKDIRGKRRVVLNCGRITGLGRRSNRKTIKNASGISKILLRKSLFRDAYELDTQYRYWKCESKTLMAATSEAPETFVEIPLTKSNFPKSESSLGKACSKVSSFPGFFIYKVVGSSHIPTSDCRRHSVALVLTSSQNGVPSSCVDVVDSKGNKIGSMGRYLPNGAYSGRYYGCYGCSGETLTGSMLSSRARSNTGSTDIYMDFGSTCYGPVNAGACKNSSAC